MKVLIDPIHTNDPALCSANFKMHKLMEYVLSVRDDVFFYYILPSKKKKGMGDWEVDKNFLSKHPNVTYIYLPTDTDRMKEYWRMSPQLEDLIAFNGKIWDFDILITARHNMVPVFRAWLSRNNLSHLKRIIIEDEFPVMCFKKRSLVPFGEAQDFNAVNCYWQADRTYVFSFSSKKHMLAAARKYLAPSRVRELDNKLVETSSVNLSEFELKSKDYIKTVASRKKQFVVASPVRIGNPHFYVPVLDLFEKHWIYHGKQKIKYLFCQNTRHVESLNKKFKYIEAVRTPRKEFHKKMREEVDVVLCMHSDLDYPLSVIEPLCLGVPAIIQRADYTEKTYGPDYPFLVNNVAEAYSVMKEFYEDYPRMYKIFADWHKEKWVPLLKSRNDLWFPFVFMKDLEACESFLKKYVADKTTDNEIVKMILKEVGADTHFNLHDVLVRLADKKLLQSLAQVIKKSRYKVPVAMATDYNLLRLRLLYQFKWHDTAQTGTFKK